LTKRKRYDDCAIGRDQTNAVIDGCSDLDQIDLAK
jgi:hypothetical protein